MSFVSEQEAHNFDRQVMAFWSHLLHRDITSPLFFLPLKLGGLGVGSAVQRHAAAPWRAWPLWMVDQVSLMASGGLSASRKR